MSGLDRSLADQLTHPVTPQSLGHGSQRPSQLQAGSYKVLDLPRVPVMGMAIHPRADGTLVRHVRTWNIRTRRGRRRCECVA